MPPPPWGGPRVFHFFEAVQAQLLEVPPCARVDHLVDGLLDQCLQPQPSNGKTVGPYRARSAPAQTREAALIPI